MNITYKTNGVETTKSLTEWYFGKKFVTKAEGMLKSSGKKEIKVWQDGTGYLTVKAN